MRFCVTKYGIVLFSISSLFFAGCSTSYDTSVECYSISQLKKSSLPSFTSYLMNVKGTEDSRIDLYLQMPYRNLRFEKTDDGYKASFSLTVLVRNKDKEIILTKELDRSITVKTFEESISSRFDAVLQTLLLKPAEYVMEIISTDHISQLRHKQIVRFGAKGFLDSAVTASSILLLDTIITDSKGVYLRPIFPSSLSLLNGSFGIFQELYNVHEGDNITISESFIKPRSNNQMNSSFNYLTPPYRLKADECGEIFDSIYFKKDSSFVVQKNGTQQLIQFFPLPTDGFNKIDRQIIILQNARKDTIRFSDNYFLRNRKLVNSLSIDEVTAAIRYILREEEYDSIASVEVQERIKRINHFWESRGGIDRRKEFEQRIMEANALFTSCSNGSETPMGIVFTICGLPDYVECQGGMTETWFYNLGERSFSIPFRREKENSIYYSLQPFSVNDSIWQYYIDQWRRKK